MLDRGRGLVIRSFGTVLAMAMNLQPIARSHSSSGFLCQPTGFVRPALGGGDHERAYALVNQSIRKGRMDDIVPAASKKVQPRVFETKLVGDWESDDCAVMVIDSHDGRDEEIERLRQCNLAELMGKKISGFEARFAGQPLETDLSSSISAEP